MTVVLLTRGSTFQGPCEDSWDTLWHEQGHNSTDRIDSWVPFQVSRDSFENQKPTVRADQLPKLPADRGQQVSATI